MSQSSTKPIKNTDYNITCTQISAENAKTTGSPPEHFHSRMEIIYAINANGDIVIGGAPFRLQSGDIAVISPGVPHTESLSGSGIYYSIKFSPEILFSSVRGLSEYNTFGIFITSGNLKTFFERSALETTGVHNTIHDIVNEWNTKRDGYEQMIRAGILRTLTQLSRVQTEQDKLLSTLQNSTIARALEYVADNCAAATELSAANHCGLSLSYFSTLFKSAVGMKFNDYLIKTKLERAKSLLVSTDKSMTFIAFETGFSSSSHFISRFKEREGTTPSKYRHEVRSGKRTHSVSTPQIIIRFENVGKPSGQYLILKYRTNRREEQTWVPFFLESNSSYATGNGLTWAVLEGDEDWHVIIIDMAKTKQLSHAFKPDSDGEYRTGHITIHPFYKTFLPSLYFDLAYVAFAKSLEQALDIIGDGEDICFGHFSTIGGDKWVKEEITCTESHSGETSLFFRSEQKLLSDAVSSGVSFRKIELLSENERYYTRVWCI